MNNNASAIEALFQIALELQVLLAHQEELPK